MTCGCALSMIDGVEGRRWVFVAAAMAVVASASPAVGRGTGGSASIAWSKEGAPAALAWSQAGKTTTSSNFGTLAADASASVQLKLTNPRRTASGKLAVGLTGSSAFSITYNGCTGKNLGRKQWCRVTVVYAPSEAGESDSGVLKATPRHAAPTKLSLSGCSAGGTCLLRPNDPGFLRHRGVYKQIDALAGWAATQGKPCTAAIADLDSYATNTTDLRVRKGANVAPGTANDSHGTAVSSVARAKTNNGVGVPGIGNCPIISVRVLDDHAYWYENTLLAGINWACSQPGVKVLNLSLWQGAGQSNLTDVSAALQACEDSGILPVLIAGNGSSNDVVGTDDPSANPLAAGNPNTLRVAGVDSDNQIHPHSNYGSALADIAAPYCVPVDSPYGTWGVGCGTSFAAPQVAAVAAEVFNLNPSLTPAEVKQLLMSSGTQVPGLDVTSGRVLDFYNALVAAGYVPSALR